VESKRMAMVTHLGRQRMVKYKHKISLPKSEKKAPLSRLKFEWYYNIKIYLQETKNTGCAIKQIGLG
jgi:hypothetical protein